MKRYWKSLTVLSMVLLMTMGLTGIASADVIRGIGWLHAKGSGVATLNMSGRIEIVSHGTGAVYIYGAEEIHAEGNGRRSDLRGGGVLFRGYEGAIHVTGKRMVVRMIGKHIEFTAHGKGVAHLRGRGLYRTHGHAGDWARDGLEIEVVEEDIP